MPFLPALVERPPWLSALNFKLLLLRPPPVCVLLHALPPRLPALVERPGFQASVAAPTSCVRALQCVGTTAECIDAMIEAGFQDDGNVSNIL
eukprot:150322-Chlamydomonas_euryale.AAC.8